MHRIILAAAAALSLGACATQTASNDAPASGDCFRSSSVSGYGIVDDHHVRVTVGPNRDYILTTLFNTRELDWSHQIALRAPTGWVCVGNGLDVEVFGGDPPRTYPIRSVERAPETPPQGS